MLSKSPSTRASSSNGDSVEDFAALELESCEHETSVEISTCRSEKRVVQKKAGYSQKCEKPSRSSFCLRSPPPSQHLKKILANYPEGPQIFKEALQNADDAGARVFRILLDERTVAGDETLGAYPQKLRRFMGPSVIFANDALFGEEDWLALQNMFESAKINSPGKIGRFGMGSRSYFHMTDVVSVLSGSRFAFLDPDWNINEDGGAADELSSIAEAHVSKNGSAREPQEDANAPGSPLSDLYALLTPLFNVMGFRIEDSFYHGTVIRLPLRQGRWARTSSFAPYEYAPAKTSGLLARFRKEASHCLLFLQSVERMEFWRWRDCDDTPYETYSCDVRSALHKENFSSIPSPYVQPRSAIRDFLDEQRHWGHDLKSAMLQADTGHLPEIENTYLVEEVEFLGTPPKDDETPEATVTTSVWLINIRLVSHSDLVALLPFTQCPPVVGVAFPTGPPVVRRVRRTPDSLPSALQRHAATTKGQHRRNIRDPGSPSRSLLRSSPVIPESHTTTPTLSTSPSTRILDLALHCVNGATTGVHRKRRCKGLAFTYLPLPDISTGLPVHIHGTFQLTDNRRSIWMALKDTEGQAQKWSEWNHTLLSAAIPQLYARVLLRFAQLTTEMLDEIETQRQQGCMEHDVAEELSRHVIDNYYAAWPDPADVPPAFHPLLYELVRCVKNQKLVIREPQSLLTVSRRLATTIPYRLDESYRSPQDSQRLKKELKNLPPLRPTEAHFLDLTDVESHVFVSREAYLYEAVAQCQLLGHPVVLVPEAVKRLLLTFDQTADENPAAQQARNEKSLGIRGSGPDWVENARHAYKGLHQHKSRNSQCPGYVLISTLDIFSRVLLPHWASLPAQELSFVPHFTHLMLCVCKILGRGPDKYILRFRNICSQLQFVPTRFPGVVYDEAEPLPLKTPPQCFDPTLDNFKIGQMSQPDKEFRSPDVLRVLRLWGLKQTLGWTEMAREAVTRMCAVNGCHGTTYGFNVGFDKDAPADS